MGLTMTAAEIERALITRGVPAAKAHAVAYASELPRRPSGPGKRLVTHLPTTNVCERCGATFTYVKTYRIRHRCDACRHRAGTLARAAIATRKRRMPTTKTCSRCGRAFVQRRSNHIFCSKDCQLTADGLRRKRTGGPGSGGANRGQLRAPRRQCEMCSTAFYASPGQLRRGGGRFCSLHCRARHMSAHPDSWPRMLNRRGRGGRRADLGNRYFRSSWEANWARYLTWLQMNGHITEWQFESETFEFPVKRGSRFYTPDFKVSYPDGRTEFHEIKGYMDQRSATKLARMQRYHPLVPLRLITPSAYKEVAEKVGMALPGWETVRGRVARAD